MKKILVSLVAMMFLVSGSAFALSIGDQNYLGWIVTGTPASQAAETSYVNYLRLMDIDTTATALENNFTRSGIDFGLMPEAFFSFKVEPAPQAPTINGSVDYVLGKYGSGDYSHVWYVAGLTSFTLPEFRTDLSHYTIFNAQQVPEPSTLLLFGAGIAGLALCRRKRS